jgi:glucose/arabinose dehydrogenase
MKGGNYGWNLFEGEQEYDNPGDVPIATTARPVADYTRSIGTCVTGGYVYRGNGVPSLRGAYLYGDFGSGRIWALRWNGSAVVSHAEIASVRNPSSFGEDMDAEVYICSFDGNIYRLAELP